MSARAGSLPRQVARTDASAAAPSPASDVVRFYDVAGPDFEAWSKESNLHFGCTGPGTSFFRRESMLERMNAETLALLQPPETSAKTSAKTSAEASAHVADLGCGVGTGARYVARHAAHTRVSAFTSVPSEVEDGRRMTLEAGLGTRVEITLCDFRSTTLADASVDGAFAIASAAYAEQPDKSDLVAEMARIVKLGGRIVVSDAFRKDSAPLGGRLGRWYRRACECFAIGEIADIKQFKLALREAGFHDVRAEEISGRMAPSIAHVPLVCLKFALQHWLRGDFRWPRERKQLVKGSLLAALLGLHRARFGWYLVSAVRDSRPKPAPADW